MQSKTSCFNTAVFKKNLTRFAPVWGLYLLCLLMGITTLYVDDGREFWFASRMGELIKAMSLVNLGYGLLVSMLLFGDLYNSRMCNGLHALPLRRETWFWTNVVSGLVFSLLPTAGMALLSLPLLMGTCVENAWQIALLWFAGTNLEFVCFFGIAVFCAFCVGTRFAMAMGYAALNGGAFLVYWLIDTLYTPMLYGVVTPSRLAETLVPLANMLDHSFVELDSYFSVRELAQSLNQPMTAAFRIVPETWRNLLAWAAVGAALMVLGLLLYRKRNLECAGDTVALPILKPVFLVGVSIAAAAFAYTAMQIFFGSSEGSALAYGFLACGLAVGWFAAWMLMTRSTRVFQPKKWLGLLALAAVLAISLVLTYFDIFGIETRVRNPEEVESASISLYYYDEPLELTEREDIENLLKLQRLALDNRPASTGTFPVVDGEVLDDKQIQESFDSGKSLEGYPCRKAAQVSLTFRLKNGNTVQRCYRIWTDREEGAIANQYLSRWEAVLDQSDYSKALDLDNLWEITVYGYGAVPETLCTREEAESLLKAIRADCDAGTMTQSGYFHTGGFRITDNMETYSTTAIYVSLYSEKGGLSFDVYADSENTLNWLRERGLLMCEVVPENVWFD